MYIYFSSNNSVLSCEEFPQVLSVDFVKTKNLEHLCDRWEKQVNPDNTFTLSFKYQKEICNCDNSQFTQLEDYNNYECYNCRRYKLNGIEEGVNLYLQNCCRDILHVNTLQHGCQLIEVSGYQNVYEWLPTNKSNRKMFALHVTEDDRLSDKNIMDKIDSMTDNCQMIFTESLA